MRPKTQNALHPYANYIHKGVSLALTPHLHPCPVFPHNREATNYPGRYVPRPFPIYLSVAYSFTKILRLRLPAHACNFAHFESWAWLKTNWILRRHRLPSSFSSGHCVARLLCTALQYGVLSYYHYNVIK